VKIRRFSLDSGLVREAGTRSRALCARGAALASALWLSVGACTPVKVDVQDSSEGLFNQGATGFVDDGVGANNLDNAACVTETSAAEQRQVAIYMMLDSSGSMQETTGTRRTKWDSVQRAMRGFLSETRDSDLLLGMQFFPLSKPGSSFTCDSQEDCGDEGGPCFLSTCRQGGTVSICRTNADCPGGPRTDPCVDFGLCSNSDPAAPLACELGEPCGNGLGTCRRDLTPDDKPFIRTCMNATQCNGDFYADPAIEIGPIQQRLAEIDSILTGQVPEGDTPTGPALTGSLAHAREWALAHPNQTVAVVLATDGLPTECGTGQPNGLETINEVLSIASEGVSGEVPIRTFVIGVFQPGQENSFQNVNAIAQAGGTDQAVYIDGSGEVEQQFLDALRSIRSGQLACEFQIPASDQQLDYFRVNLQFDSGAGAQQLPFVRDSGGCAATPNGWHYDVDPAQKKPSSIEICPSVCSQAKAAASGNIRLQLGCATILR